MHWKRHSIFRWPIVIAFLIPSLTSLAQDSLEQDVFERPEIISTPAPDYPYRASQRGEEGWVVLGFMLDVEGKPFEPYVVRSVGDEDFVEAALEVVDQFEFKPATLNGEAVATHIAFNMYFSLAPGARTAPGFLNEFRDFMEALDGGDLEQAERELRRMDRMPGKSRFDHSYFNFARYRYEARTASKEEQLEYLTKAIVHVGIEPREGEEIYLPPELLKVARHTLFLLQMDLALYSEAIASVEAIEKSGLEADMERYADVLLQLQALAENDEVYAVPAVADAQGKWRFELFKKGFYLESDGIGIESLKLRCKNRFAELEYVEGNQYKIPGSWRSCELEITSDENASYSVIQF